MSSPSFGPKRVKLLTAKTSGTSEWIDVMGYETLTMYFKTNGNPGAGTCIIEEADFDPMASPGAAAGSVIATIDIDAAVGTDSQYAYHFGGSGGNFSYSYVRARIGTTVTVATLDVVLVAV